MKRRTEFDVARGLMLVLMTLSHLPTRLAQPAGQPLGYVSAAEGFVLLSAFMGGLVYARRAQTDGMRAMKRAFIGRALTVYVCQAALLVFLFTVIAALGLAIDRPAVTDLISLYLQQPLIGLWSALALLYNPPLLDILPLYVLLLLASPFVLSHGLRHGWIGIFALSLALWFASQFGLSEWLYTLFLAPTGFAIPLREMGSFHTFAWQLLWVLGLWMGATAAQAGEQDDAFGAFPRWWLRAAWAYALFFFVWRQVMGQLPQPEHGHLMNLLFDKWTLGPLRLLNLLALLTLAMHHGPALLARLPRQRWLAWLGTASLPVFCAHLVLVLMALALLGGVDLERPLWIDLLLVAASFVVLTITALVSRAVDRQAAALLQRRRDRRARAPQLVVPPNTN